MRFHPLVLIAALAALTGLLFAGFSTRDFASHLDRQVHGLQCSFFPGITAADETGGSGCHVTLMSPYSSIMRDSVWGGVPISLPAMSVFAFLFFWAVRLMAEKRDRDSAATGFFVLAAALPALTSIVMAYISLSELDATCKICIGIYISSAVAFACALLVWLRARRRAAPVPGPDMHDSERAAPAGPLPLTMPKLVIAFLLGVVAVVIPVVVYASAVPDFNSYVAGCGTLPRPGDLDRILVPLGSQQGAVPVVEVLDPLCPACRGFERRFDALASHENVKRQALLFPLDNTCNWMVDDAIHPGACVVSEAILCAQGRAEEVLDWAFDEQESIREAAARDPSAAARAVLAKFPDLRNCVGKPAVRAQLNRALRWAVQNQLPVLTPQVYIGGTRLCDADTDLGLDYVMHRMLEKAIAGGGGAR